MSLFIVFMLHVIYRCCSELLLILWVISYFYLKFLEVVSPAIAVVNIFQFENEDRGKKLGCCWRSSYLLSYFSVCYNQVATHCISQFTPVRLLESLTFCREFCNHWKIQYWPLKCVNER